MKPSRTIIYIKLLRASFFTASVLPVLLGTAVAYSAVGVFNPVIFVLAVLAMIFFHAGANITNDYFDHLSGNDWLNDNPTPFSGGSRVIQQDLISPFQVIRYAVIIFGIGIIAGLAIVIITRSIFILVLGTAGLFGAFFYTANPLRLGYRAAGEITIALLFGILPVYGAYYIQTGSFDFSPILPGIIVSLLIFEIILANEFPDHAADNAVSKRTIVVTLGIEKSAFIYRTVLVLIDISVLIWLVFVSTGKMSASVVFVLSLVMTLICYKQTSPQKLRQKGTLLLSRATVLLHLLLVLALASAELASKP